MRSQTRVFATCIVAMVLILLSGCSPSEGQCDRTGFEVAELARRAVAAGLPAKQPKIAPDSAWPDNEYDALRTRDPGAGFFEIDLLQRHDPELYRRLDELWRMSPEIRSCGIPRLLDIYAIETDPQVRAVLAKYIRVALEESRPQAYVARIETRVLDLLEDEIDAQRATWLVQSLQVIYLDYEPSQTSRLPSLLGKAPSCDTLEAIADLLATVSAKYESTSPDLLSAIRGSMEQDECRDRLKRNFVRNMLKWKKGYSGAADAVALSLLDADLESGGGAIAAGILHKLRTRKEFIPRFVCASRSSDINTRCIAISALETGNPNAAVSYDKDQLAVRCVTYSDERDDWSANELRVLENSLDEASQYWTRYHVQGL